MRVSDWNDPADESANPRRAEERDAVRQELIGRLATRRIEVCGDESDDQVARLVDAVDRFEAAVARLGGDSMVNDPNSSQPDDPALVVPLRRGDESADAYIDRISAAADAVEERATSA